MALINTLRNKMGKLVVAAVSIAILSFILMDFMGPGSTFGGNDNEIGEIAGHNIALQEFQAKVQEMENQFMMATNRQPTERDMTTIREQAWEMLINEYAVEKQYKKAGVTVTEEEMWDRVQGQNIDPGIRQSFTNPETGEFDRQMFLQYLQTIQQQPPQVQVQWNLYKQNLRPARERMKYENLILKTDYVTTAEAMREYQAQNNVADVKYLYVPYSAVPDSAVHVTESDIEEYYEKNKEEFKTKGSKSIKYVSFPIFASAEDSAMVREEMIDIYRDFKATEDDSLYAAVNTDAVNFYRTYKPGTLPANLQAAIDTMEQGEIAGPFFEGNRYKIIKLTEAAEDTVDYARASHILIKWDEDTQEARREAREEARKILREIQEGADFAAMARKHSEDGLASRGGDLGWFQSGKYVEELENAIFNARQEGVLPNLVESEYGYHIVNVRDVKQNKLYTVASIERDIIAGTETINEAYRKADLFAAEVSGLEELEEKAAEQGLNVIPVEDIQKNDRIIGRLDDARQIVQWLFREADVGDVSSVFELNNAYVVVAVTDQIEEGYLPLSEVKNDIRKEVKDKLQGELIISKLKEKNGSLEDMAQVYNEDANIYSMSDLKLSANSMTGIGSDPKAVGVAFSLEEGETSEPFRGENGVLVIHLQNKTQAPEIADYETYKNQLKRGPNTISENIVAAIKEKAEIEDERYKFY
ncbi:MAG: SurA N-terminal domain-containing protein [Candidatus Cyclobacteriaceae bacterium M2_1C_046]